MSHHKLVLNSAFLENITVKHMVCRHVRRQMSIHLNRVNYDALQYQKKDFSNQSRCFLLVNH